MPRTRPWEVSDEFWEQVRPLIPVLATWDIRSEKRLFESDLLVLFCLQERSDKGRIRGHACIHALVSFFLFAKVNDVIPVLIPINQRQAHWFSHINDVFVIVMLMRFTITR